MSEETDAVERKVSYGIGGAGNIRNVSLHTAFLQFMNLFLIM